MIRIKQGHYGGLLLRLKRKTTVCKGSDNILKAVAILPLTTIYSQRLFCRELFVIGQSY